ncbi:MAG: long-chain-fatty-acid--CoA ligase [Deltaproteobacteria bacterium]|nr:long-chain-fatty-acid--CoA ligase [Deltaproteobacteria bacterium]
MHSFADPLNHARRTAARRSAFVCGNESFAYADLVARCEALVGALLSLGLERGDRVAILADNCHRYVETYMAVPAGGMVVVPLNTRHAEPELRYALEDSGARVLLTDRDPSTFAAVVDHVVTLPDGYETLLDQASPAELGAGIDENSLAGLFYTGGTTGASKGVMLSHRNLIANAFHWLAVVPQEPDDRFLCMAPMFHAAGSIQFISTVWTGGCQVVLPTFDPAAALDLIEEHEITVSLGVPAMLAAIAEEQLARPRRTSSLRACGHGGSPIATEVVRRAHAAMPSAELIEVYGATELSPLATALRNEQDRTDDERGRSCGQPVPGVEIKILDAQGKECAPGEVGEVTVRGPNVMQGYWGKPEQSAAALVDGRYWTGDLGTMDDGGYLFLVDRSKDMIVSGGENVYSTEVEEILYQHPAVLEAAVFGIPDEKWGEAVHAVIVPREGCEALDTAELISLCRDKIASYKVPKAIELRSEPLPKSGPGKVLKRELRAPYWADRDRQVG